MLRYLRKVIKKSEKEDVIVQIETTKVQELLYDIETIDQNIIIQHTDELGWHLGNTGKLYNVLLRYQNFTHMRKSRDCYG